MFHNLRFFCVASVRGIWKQKIAATNRFCFLNAICGPWELLEILLTESCRNSFLTDIKAKTNLFLQVIYAVFVCQERWIISCFEDIKAKWKSAIFSEPKNRRKSNLLAVKQNFKYRTDICYFFYFRVFLLFDGYQGNLAYLHLAFLKW